jgi:uncharacterized protein YggE
MDTTKPLLATVAVLSVFVVSLFVGLNEQRQEMAVRSGQQRVVPLLGDAWSGLGGAYAAEGQVTDKTLFVSGTASASSDPDKVTIVFSVETEDKSASVSQQQNAQLTSAVKAALVAKGIAAGDIETVYYQLYQDRQYDPDLRRYVDMGFKTAHSMKVELSDVGRAGEIIDAAVGAGANSVSSVSFGLSDGRMEQLRMQALEEAASNAKQKAGSIASGLGVAVSRVMSASEGYSYSPAPYVSYDMAAGAGSTETRTDIVPGEVQVTAQVSVVFEIA